MRIVAFTILTALSIAPFAWAAVVCEETLENLTPHRVILTTLLPQSDFYRHLEPCGRILKRDGCTVWGCSPICGEDGKVHVFYLRWCGSFNNWIATWGV